MPYRHTQHAPGMYVIAVAGAVIGYVGLAATGLSALSKSALVALAILLILVGVLAPRLTVTVDGAGVTSAFGWGWPRRRIELDDIQSVAAVRNSWWHGWGIRKVRRGWMFNNAGYDAVELTTRSGKVFRIGTDQPDQLLAALERAHTA